MVEPFTELSAFSEIFRLGRINFHDRSGQEVMDVENLTAESIKAFGETCQVADLETFVTEGFKIISSALAEFEARKLF